MPKLMNQSTSLVAQTISNFGFSGTQIDDLKDLAGEFTLANVEIDVSPSTGPFIDELKKALGVVIESLAMSPRANNLLMRLESFNESLVEIHGFTPLTNVHPGNYDFQCGGHQTALYDAILSGIEACGAYGQMLDEKDFTVNAINFIITDGMENASRKARNTGILAKGQTNIRTSEHLESYKTILIGVGDESQVEGYLQALKADAQLDQFIWVGAANPKSLAKLADFISRSVSSASAALGTGGTSQNLVF